MPSEILLSPALKDTSPGPRSYRRFAVALSGLAWRDSAGPPPTLADKNLTQAMRITLTDMSLTGMFFVSETFISRGTRLWVRVRVSDQLLQLPVEVRRVTEEVVKNVRSFGCGVQYLRSSETAAALPILAGYLLNRTEVALTH